MDDLKVLDGGLGDAAVEVEHVGLGVVVPHRGLVVQLDQVVQGVVLPLTQQAVLLLQGTHTHTQLSHRLYTHSHTLMCVRTNCLLLFAIMRIMCWF